METRSIFAKIRWKSGVEVFENNERGQRILLARLGESAVILAPENIGGFIETIDSEAKAMELGTFFQHGVLFMKQSDVRAFIQACREHKVGKINKEEGTQLVMGCSLDAGKSTYRVSLVSYRERNLVVANYNISFNGHIDYHGEDLVEGPPVVEGWDAPDEHFKAYVQRSEQFEVAIEPIVGRVAAALLQDVRANDQGMSLARQHALEWLLEKRTRVQIHAKAIEKAIEEDSISAGLKQRAMSEIKRSSIPQ